MGPHYLNLAESLLRKPFELAHGMNLLSLADMLELALNNL